MVQPGGFEEIVDKVNRKNLEIRDRLENKQFVNGEKLARHRSNSRAKTRTYNDNKNRLKIALQNLEGISQQWREGVNQLLANMQNPNLEADMRAHSDAMRVRMKDVVDTVADLPARIDDANGGQQ